MARKKQIRANTWEDKRARKEKRKKLAQDQWKAGKSQRNTRKSRKVSASPHGRHTEEEPMAHSLQGTTNPKSRRRREKDRRKRRERRDLKRKSWMEEGHGRSRREETSSLYRTVTSVYVDLAIRF